MVEVVAAALIVDGRVLAALRRTPPGWEFPGGKIEPGESPEHAVARECREELGIDVRPTVLLGSASADGVALQLWQVDAADIPTGSTDHDALRWLAAAELDAPDWLPVDRALLDAVRPQLR